MPPTLLRLRAKELAKASIGLASTEWKTSKENSTTPSKTTASGQHFIDGKIRAEYEADSNFRLDGTAVIAKDSGFGSIPF